MKKSLITFIFIIVATMASHAAPPRLACETLFSDTGIRNENTEIMISKAPDNYYRAISVTGDPKLVKLMEQKVFADRERAFNTSEKYTGKDTYSIILNIENNDHVINIGFTRYSDSDAKLFVQSELAAFQ